MRFSGPSDPPMRDLAGGKYAHAWADMNAARADGEANARLLLARVPSSPRVRGRSPRSRTARPAAGRLAEKA